jgi:hypothetical protein
VTHSNYEKFRQPVFEEMHDIPQAEREQLIEDFVKAGSRVGVDVVGEIVDKQRSAAEVLAEVRAKSDAMEKSGDTDTTDD